MWLEKSLTLAEEPFLPYKSANEHRRVLWTVRIIKVALTLSLPLFLILPVSICLSLFCLLVICQRQTSISLCLLLLLLLFEICTLRYRHCSLNVCLYPWVDAKFSPVWAAEPENQYSMWRCICVRWVFMQSTCRGTGTLHRMMEENVQKFYSNGNQNGWHTYKMSHVKWHKDREKERGHGLVRLIHCMGFAYIYLVTRHNLWLYECMRASFGEILQTNGHSWRPVP